MCGSLMGLKPLGNADDVVVCMVGGDVGGSLGAAVVGMVVGDAVVGVVVGDAVGGMVVSAAVVRMVVGGSVVGMVVVGGVVNAAVVGMMVAAGVVASIVVGTVAVASVVARAAVPAAVVAPVVTVAGPVADVEGWVFPVVVDAGEVDVVVKPPVVGAVAVVAVDDVVDDAVVVVEGMVEVTGVAGVAADIVAEGTVDMAVVTSCPCASCDATSCNSMNTLLFRPVSGFSADGAGKSLHLSSGCTNIHWLQSFLQRHSTAHCVSAIPLEVLSLRSGTCRLSARYTVPLTTGVETSAISRISDSEVSGEVSSSRSGEVSSGGSAAGRNRARSRMSQFWSRRWVCLQ